MIEEARNGRMFILVDDEDRENEGDLVIPAQFATPDAINFMARHGRGLICLALTRAARRAARPAADEPAQRHPPPDRLHRLDRGARRRHHRHLRARPRAHRRGGDQSGQAARDDIVTPGHVFPLMAREGGVLVRAGHTEAAVDIARLAGLNPSAVICEIMNDDGTMARLPDLVSLRAAPQPEARHHRRSDRLSPPHRAAGQAGRRGRLRPRRRRRLARHRLCQHRRIPGAHGAGEGRSVRPRAGAGAHARRRPAGRHDRSGRTGSPCTTPCA